MPKFIRKQRATTVPYSATVYGSHLKMYTFKNDESPYN